MRRFGVQALFQFLVHPVVETAFGFLDVEAFRGLGQDVLERGAGEEHVAYGGIELRVAFAGGDDLAALVINDESFL